MEWIKISDGLFLFCWAILIIGYFITFFGQDKKSQKKDWKAVQRKNLKKYL